MLVRDDVIRTVSEFPENFTLDELVEKLIFMDKVDKGLEQSRNNKVHSHEEARTRLSKWVI